MRSRSPLGLLSIAVVCLIAAAPMFADDPPVWLRQAAAVNVSGYDKDTPAVTVLDEEQVVLGSDSKLVTTENFAVRLLTREGRRFALARAFYFTSSGKVRDIKAWIVRPDGTTKYYDKKFIVDLISDPDDVYNEGRMKIIDATDDVDAGYVFGYTIVSEQTPLFYQDVWGFQGPIPTVVSRYALTLPTGWKATSTTFNTSELNPRVNGTTYTWEMNNLPKVPDEPMSPSIINMAARIAINYSPESPDKTVNRVFTNWTDVSKWATAMHDPHNIIDDNIAAKARELTANAQTEFDKIRAIGTFVQNLQYISIDIGVGHGNGYAPRPSTTVLGRGYGDCKDKANLMRALLRVLKIESYPIAIYSGDPTFVKAEWPSPRQFNHCIIAVRVSDATQSPAIIKHETLGRLLIFDATDPYTSVGDLPDHEQGSFALIIAGGDGGLATMPIPPPENNMLERKIEAAIGINGEMTGTIRERALGQTSAIFRSEVRTLSATDFQKAIEGWLTRGATGAKLVSVKSKDNVEKSSFDLDIDFSAPRYGQIMQGRLLVFKPVFVGRRNDIFLTENKRLSPVELDSHALAETATFTLPTGFAVDEMPDAVNLDTAFGKYSTKYEVKGDKLHFTRTLTIKRSSVPVEKYDTVKSFFAKMRDAEQAPVVLIKK
ncbi:MAG: DUF3857 domain-containing protein [Pyrinomonadaceae bacterium]